ncbi:MAG: alpha/beta fold hydrolase [Acinetobacter sp.]|nr:alpha/beta fold hydrolase [Acinetobacter sp.]MBP6353414.1 alpha/beta fold hydrolase [Acinetobacter sp.]
MDISLKKSLLVVLCSSSLLLTACHDNDDDGDRFSSRADKKIYSVDNDVLNVAAVHDVFSYAMPSVQNKEITATTLVFTPKGTPPVGGWPIVVWAHGTVGGADQCAPSNNALTGVEKQIIMALLQKGYAVVAPDYEGLGNTAVAHPYLNLGSAAKSVLFAVDAVHNRYANLSKEWSVIGWSQGGHAALATAEFSSTLNSKGFQYKGTVAVAPASNLQNTLDYGLGVAQLIADSGALNQAVPIAATLYTYTAIVASGIKAEKTSFNYNQAFVESKVAIASQAETRCSTELGQVFGGDIQTTLQLNGGNYDAYKALQDGFRTDPDIVAFLAKNNPGQLKLEKPVYIYQGELDTTVPFEITEQVLVPTMRSKGTDVHLVPKIGQTHQTIMENNITELATQVDILMQQ